WRHPMRYRWFVFALAVAVAVWSAAPAQPPIPIKDGVYTVPMTVDATAPPRPALKYRLLPDLREMKSGNQVQAFYKCFFEQNKLFYDQESTAEQERWLAAPLKELAEVPALVNYGGQAVKQAHYAARLDTVDWQLTNQVKAEGAF